MRHPSSLSLSSAMQTSTTPVTRSTTTYPREAKTAESIGAKCGDSVADLSSDDATVAKDVFELLLLPRCRSTSSSPLKLASTVERTTKRVPSDESSSASDEESKRRRRGHAPHNDITLSGSSRGLPSAAFTDDIDGSEVADNEAGSGEENEESDDDDVSSVGGCTAHEVEGFVSAVKTCVFMEEGGEEKKDVDVDLQHTQQPRMQPINAGASSAHVDNTATTTAVAAGAAPSPFASLSTSPMSWSAMRKLRLESARNSLTTRPETVSGLSSSDAKPQRGSDRLTPSSSNPSQLHRDASTAPTTVRFALQHEENESRTLVGETKGGSGSSSRLLLPSTGYWTLAPRLRGVNELLLTTPNAQLFREALDALHVWDTAVKLDLHQNSAGGTYMVRLALPHSGSEEPTSPLVGAAHSPRSVLCVFKPRDEEIGQETNPHGNRESDRTVAFAPGSGSRREVLAYRLDHGHNAGVPPTLEVATGYCTPQTNFTSNGGCGGEKSGATQPVSCSGCSDAAGRSLSGHLVYSARGAVRSPAGLSDLSTQTMGTVRAGAGGVAREQNEARFASGRCSGRGDTNVLRGSPMNHPDSSALREVDEGENGESAHGASTMPQIGSLQLFLPGCQEAADVLPGRFPTEEVHALAIFDIRTLNGDRHGGNVLVQNYRSSRSRSSSPRHKAGQPPAAASTTAAPPPPPPHLIPIDHSYICPSGYADPDYEWLSWPQAKRPFSPFHLQYIAELDAVADAELVRAALLAHSTGYGGSISASLAFPTNAAAAATHRGRAESDADVFDLSACTVYRGRVNGEGRSPTMAASGVSCSEYASVQQRELCLLDDGVRRARAVAQEHGVPLEASCTPCSAASPLLLHGGYGSGEGVYGDSCTDLTIFSPVRTLRQTPPLPGHGQRDEVMSGAADGSQPSASHAEVATTAAVAAGAASPAFSEDFESPGGFSMTALPEHIGRAAEEGERVAGSWDRWAEATAELLDSCNDGADKGQKAYSGSDTDRDSDDGIQWEQQQKKDFTGRRTTHTSSSNTPSLSFATYGGATTGESSQRGDGVDAVTYDKDTANAAATVMWCTTRLLQIAALEFHKTAYEIGSLCRRPRVTQASFLEGVMEDARDEFSWEVVRSTFDSLVRQRLATMPKS